MSEHRIMTLHMPQRAEVMDQLLSAVEDSLVAAGAVHVWIDPSSGHDLTVMAELPDGADLRLVEVPEPRAAESVVRE